MIRQYQHLKFWKAVCYFKGRYLETVMPTPHEAWQSLIENVAIEATARKNQ